LDAGLRVTGDPLTFLEIFRSLARPKSARKLAKCDSEQARAKQQKASCGYREESFGHEVMITHATLGRASHIENMKLMWVRNLTIPVNSVLAEQAHRRLRPSGFESDQFVGLAVGVALRLGTAIRNMRQRNKFALTNSDLSVPDEMFHWLAERWCGR
jgi:hypothetical protein